MIYANSELKYTECHFCGLERECFMQYEFDEEQAVCPSCLRMADHD